jgi:hypothetical protein
MINAAEFVNSAKLSLEASERLIRELHRLLSPPGVYYRPQVELEQINEMSNSHGVEVYTTDLYQELSSDRPVCYYLNTGDTYNLTVIYDCIFQQFEITTLGDFVERFERFEGLAIALSELPVEWGEWREKGDDESYYPVRLQLLKGDYHLHYGDPSFDTDLRGLWGNAQLVEEMSDRDYLEVILDMAHQIEQQKD